MSFLRRLVKQHPLVSNMVLYAGLYTSGDLSRQAIQGARKPDFYSAARLGLVGSLLIGPFNFKWYKILDSIIKGSGARVVAKKIVCDQAVAGPIGTVVFYLGTSVLEQQKDKFKELREKGLQTYLTGCVFWPTAQIINFAFLPTHWRTPYVGCAAFVWCNIISFIKSINSHGQVEIIEADLLAPDT